MSLKVFDLQCGNGHVFEGWFSVSNSFDKQLSEGLLNCPVCGDSDIERKLSAPRLNLGRRGDDESRTLDEEGRDMRGGAPAGASELPQLAEFQGKVLQHMRQLVKNSEDMGASFAREALKIHRGEAPERAIRGTASTEDRRELLDEGIVVMPVPDFLNDDQLQ